MVISTNLKAAAVYSSSGPSLTPFLLSPAQLKDLRSSTETVVLDASWHMPNSPRKAKDEFFQKRIPNARYLDLDEVASPHGLGLKHMLPTGEIFAQACGWHFFAAFL